MPTRFLQLGVRKLGNIITYYGVKKRLYAAGGLQRESALRMQANRRFAKRTLVLRGNGLRMQAKARFAPCGRPFGGFMLALGNRDQVLYRGGARLGVSENRRTSQSGGSPASEGCFCAKPAPSRGSGHVDVGFRRRGLNWTVGPCNLGQSSRKERRPQADAFISPTPGLG